MENSMEELKTFARDNNVSFEDLAEAAGVDLSTFYRKVKKGRGAFTIGEVQGMVDKKVMPKEVAIRIFLS